MSYDPGVGLTAGLNKKNKAQHPANNKTKKRKTGMPVEKTNRACKCGSVTHKCTSHKDCPLNKGS